VARQGRGGSDLNVMVFVSAVEPPGSSSTEPPLYFVVHRRGLVVTRDGGGMRMLHASEAESVRAPAATEEHYLGRLGGADVFAMAAKDQVDSPFDVIGLRGLFGEVDDTTFGVAGRAVQIVDWAATHRFCGRCATPTERAPGERAMRCPACRLSAYPRIAPAIIVLVRKGDEALLAHGARFPMPFYSTLAGFVEPGESLEETLVREVKEEVGIDVTDLRYFGSQSWPFPNSLMLGFFATWSGGEIVVDKTEIVDAKWFRADELPMIPPSMSISRQLIDVWLADVANAKR
jgi:NAD+ diphosphatase